MKSPACLFRSRPRAAPSPFHPLTALLACCAALLLAPPVRAQVANDEVTQDNIHDTICVRGWSASVRPPSSVTRRIKRKLLKEQGLPWSAASQYELDHVVPIEDGGHPSAPANLKLQAWDGADGARAKDQVENAVHRRICAGTMTLAQGQACFSGDWRHCK